jgi:hypothetical protein
LNSRFLTRALGCAVCCFVALTGCDESLPPRIDPPVVLVASVKTNTIVVIFDSDTVRAGGEFEVDVRNIYNEVLSENARVVADLTVQLPSDPDSSRALRLTAEDLYRNKMLAYGVLTVGVGDTLRLVRRWDHRFQGGAPVWVNAHFQADMTKGGMLYYRSDTLQVNVTGKVQLFDRIQAIPFPQTVTPLVYLLYNMPPPRNLGP